MFEYVEIAFEIIISIGGVGAIWHLIFAIFANNLAGIHVFLIFGKVVTCGGIETSGEEIGVGFAFGGIGRPASCGHPFSAVTCAVDVDRDVDAVGSAIHIAYLIHTFAAVVEFLLLLGGARRFKEVGGGYKFGMVDKDNQAERFQLNLDGAYKLAGEFRLAKLAIWRTLARSCGEVGSAENNYFCHCYFVFDVYICPAAKLRGTVTYAL